jgi:rod shape determining protein RodA
MVGWRDYLRHLDYILIAAAAGLIGYGMSMIYFATLHDGFGAPWTFLRQQIIAAVLGVVIAVVMSLVDYEVYRRFQWALYGIAVVLLALVIPFGQNVHGARRWIDLGVIHSFQPSALAFLLLSLSIGAYLADRMDLLGSVRVTIVALVLAALPAALVYQEPDFGSAMVIVVLVLAMLYFYGTSWKQFAVLGAAGGAAFVGVVKLLPMVGVNLVHQYQLTRLFVFLDIANAPPSASYNIIQSMIAVGSGAMTGRGSMATQTTLDFLPEHHTDFIFAVIGERNGFLGATVLLMLYAVFIWRCLRIATLSRDMYGSILAGGIGVMMMFQVFVNIGMTIGIMPVTGIPLPFVSYGGTALITFLMLVGLLEAIHLRATVTPTDRGRLVQ